MSGPVLFFEVPAFHQPKRMERYPKRLGWAYTAGDTTLIVDPFHPT